MGAKGRSFLAAVKSPIVRRCSFDWSVGQDVTKKAQISLKIHTNRIDLEGLPLCLVAGKCPPETISRTSPRLTTMPPCLYLTYLHWPSGLRTCRAQMGCLCSHVSRVF